MRRKLHYVASSCYVVKQLHYGGRTPSWIFQYACRSTGGNITLYNGNQLLASLNCIQWTAQYGDARSVTVATTAPEPKLFNVDLAARAFLDHLQGTAVLPADVLQKGEHYTHCKHRLLAAGLHLRTVLAKLSACCRM